MARLLLVDVLTLQKRRSAGLGLTPPAPKREKQGDYETNGGGGEGRKELRGSGLLRGFSGKKLQLMENGTKRSRLLDTSEQSVAKRLMRRK